ncbi:histidine phosphatase family protein [Paralimibaculum aggregatum]|uniref:Histidine phosphatase family protein n=1 Tax=Paralimibaculum aggregatum TaxID=3036245 RepID=A0ABQ6LS37_9RHOB|nr:histidine phosphatase family protein [Limibaculum sp. NKW23]GMG84734.1 histidine phosphatase family protein [Limibaculum sp. NKW23]
MDASRPEIPEACPPALRAVRFAHPFWFLRHGETVYNRDRRLQGQRDTALSPLGRRQAEAAAETLAGAPIRRIVASPLQRARITAETVAARHRLGVETDAALMECHLGIHEGEAYPPWMPDYWQGRFAPEGGESFAAFRDRVWPAMARAAAAPGTLIVVHGGLWYAARSLVRMVPDIASMPNCLPLRVRPEGAAWQVERLGSAAEATTQDFGPAAERGA